MFVSQQAEILHVDVDSFFASVEQRDNPGLRGRPVIVGTWVVLAASYEAKAFGIHSAMGGRQARRLCPAAAFVEPRMEAYSAASKAMFEVFEDTTPLVEGLSIDEAFLDPLPVERLWGVGPVTSSKLNAQGLMTVGQVAELSEGALVRLLGRASGRHVHALAHNRDPRRVDIGRRRKSIGSQRALGRRPRSHEELDLTLIGIADRLGRRLRAAHRLCRTVVLRLRFGDYSRATRSHTLPDPTARTQEILDTARALFAVATPVIRERGLTLIGLSLTNLENEAPVQLPLPFTRRHDAALDAALDVIRDRFGSSAVTRAVLLGRDSGFAMPV